MASLLNGISSLGSGLISFGDDAIKEEVAKETRPRASLMNDAPPPPPQAEAKAEPAKPGPRMPEGVNPYGTGPHAQALWLAERAIVGPESGGRADAQNPLTSAGGKFQIIDSTFKSALQKMGITPPQSQAELNAMKYDPDWNTKIMRQINSEAASALASQGLPVNVETLQAAHRLGPGGAAAAIKAAISDPDAPLVGNGLPGGAIRGNGDIARLTVSQFLARPYPGAK